MKKIKRIIYVIYLMSNLIISNRNVFVKIDPMIKGQLKIREVLLYKVLQLILITRASENNLKMTPEELSDLIREDLHIIYLKYFKNER